MNHFNIPLLNPFKFIKDLDSKGIHFDDRWAKDQIFSWQLKTYYQQKWIRSKTTKLQIESSIAPNNLLAIDPMGQTVKSFPWTTVYTAINYRVYETEFDMSDQPEGVYFLYQLVEFGAFSWPAISEPINIKNNWDNLLEFNYKNSFNDFDVAFSTGVDFYFYCEGAIPPQEFIPKRGATEMENQNSVVSVLKGYPNRSFNLHIGGTPSDRGVAPWVIDLLNRVFDCDIVYINEKRFTAGEGEEWKKKDFPGYPLVTGVLEIKEADNKSSMQFADTTPLLPGIVVAYEFETDFFGPGASVPIIDVQENQ